MEERVVGGGGGEFLAALALRSSERRAEDVATIAAWLRRHDVFRRLGEGPLRAVARSARYERHPASHLLFRRGSIAAHWYILLSGAVFIDGQMFLPRTCFGRRSGVSNRRHNDCLVLEPSEMIVIDYPERNGADSQRKTARKAVQSMNLERAPPSVAMRNLYYPGRQGPSQVQQRPPTHEASAAPFGAHLLPRPPPSNSSSHSHSHGHGHAHQGSAYQQASATIAVNGNGREELRRGFYGGSSSTSSRSTETLMEEEGMGTLGRNGSLASTEREVSEVVHRSEVYLSGEDPTTTTTTSTGTSTSTSLAPPSVQSRQPLYERREAYEARRRGSLRSSTSSEPRTISSSTGNEEGADGAMESEDEDDESCPSGDSFLELRDSVRDCLEKEPEERTEAELDILLEFMAHMPAFASLPLQLKRQLCTRMVFAMVEKGGKTVMKDGEELDSWCVIVNGEVEIIYADGSRTELAMGDSFGVQPSPEKQFMKGTMRTLVGDCQFVLVTQEHYVSIMSELSEQLRQHRDEAGETICETERRTLDSRQGYVLVKAKPDKLIAHLVEERDTAVDPFYVEDFLLTYRTFIPSPATIFKALLRWFEDPALRDKVARLVLLWVNNHFNDFESNAEMMKLLEEFEACLEKENLHSLTQLLNIACSVKSRARVVTFTRSDREDALHFSIIGGAEKRQGIYVAKVEPGTQAQRVGLKRGDQILSVNNRDFSSISQADALAALRRATHLSISLKSNLLGFKELLASSPQQKSGKMSRKGNSMASIGPNPSLGSKPQNGSISMPPKDFPIYHPEPGAKVGSKFSRLMDRIRPNVGSLSVTEPEPPTLVSGLTFSGGLSSHGQVHPMSKSLSNPDLHHIHHGAHGIAGGISQYYPASSATASRATQLTAILKIYRSDQTFKFVPVFEETTAAEAVKAALAEFPGMEKEEEKFDLFKVSVSPEGVVKQSRLPEPLKGLAEKAELNSRYYIQGRNSREPLVTDDGAAIQKEATAQLLNLKAEFLAAQVTLTDFAIFAAVEPTEYIDDLFNLDSVYGKPKLSVFAELVNKEMWWVVTEVCRERNLYRRAKLIKKFIQMAKACRDFKNFNTMFAILSGLDKPAVRRLHATWDKVPQRYHRILSELQNLFAPSRNMSAYRGHLSQVGMEPPAIPLYPVLKKDLTFIQDGNPSEVDGLVNFEKLRMVAKEVRAASRLASAPYEISTMFPEGESGEALLQVNPYDNSVATMRRGGFAAAKELPRKKLWERAHQVRRVKAYLERLEVVELESELDKLSLECEAGLSSSSLGNVSGGRGGRRQPSPSPSNLSANSNGQEPLKRYTGPKFGVESPSAVQKMLSLAETTKTVTSSASSPAASPIQPRRFLRSQPSRQANSASHSHSASSVASMVAQSGDAPPPPHHPDSHRISSTGSVTSTDSAVSGGSVRGGGGGGAMSHAVSCDSTDSGHASIDAASTAMAPQPPRHHHTATAIARRASPSTAFLDAPSRSPKTRAPPPPCPSVAHRSGPTGPNAAAAPPPPRRRSGSRHRPPPPSATDQHISRV